MSAILTTPLQAECVGEPANKGQRINLCASGPFHGGKILKPEQEALSEGSLGPPPPRNHRYSPERSSRHTVALRREPERTGSAVLVRNQSHSRNDSHALHKVHLRGRAELGFGPSLLPRRA